MTSPIRSDISLHPTDSKATFSPSDFMRSNVYHSFQEDALGIQLRHMIGVDNLMWGSDYPHAESTFRNPENPKRDS